MSEYVAVAKFHEIPSGQGRAFPVGDQMIAVFNEAGNFRAIDDACPHQGASLAEGYLCDGEVSCPWHAWRFRLQDGAWADNPRLKVNAYHVKLEDGQVWVCTEPLPDQTASDSSS